MGEFLNPKGSNNPRSFLHICGEQTKTRSSTFSVSRGGLGGGGAVLGGEGHKGADGAFVIE